MNRLKGIYFKGGGGGGGGGSASGSKVYKDGWTTPSGAKIEVEGSVNVETTIQVDGTTVKRKTPEVTTKVNVKANGVSQGDRLDELTPAQKKAYPGFTHKVGKVALTPEQVSRVEEVRSKVEKHPAVKAQKERRAQGNKAAERVDAARRKVERANR